ncbi:2-hydroxyglutaryl-CoA dehydratase [Anoxybacter fermentans]|uniref:2-hydroxyglutaryl-CoA dehydratase n=1 Tax=Anoxybacter fermentans TaxID=1323375 RepID=A0A3S9SXU3_9FIRM|nr:acyl-CoA dehydratase activase [Anoxybacter fermentans]AZR73062.1 2-hydroxyglutaryl-CoA dehydratase [Anoxybacter fermentans]
MSIYFAGIDVGSRTCKGVIIDTEGKIISTGLLKTGVECKKNAYKLFQNILDNVGIDKSQVKFVVGTGYGRNNIEFAQKKITEITCHARGAHYLFPEIRGLVDIGGQDSKVIRLDEKGRVLDFSMNDKCAAGTGRFLEMMALTMDLTLDEMGKLAKMAKQRVSLSSVCTVFAESEIITYIHEGVAQEDIIAGLCESVANRVMELAKKVKISFPVAMTGGVAKNLGVVKALEKKFGFPLKIPKTPQLVGALGAALLAKEYYQAI